MLFFGGREFKPHKARFFQERVGNCIKSKFPEKDLGPYLCRYAKTVVSCFYSSPLLLFCVVMPNDETTVEYN